MNNTKLFKFPVGIIGIIGEVFTRALKLKNFYFLFVDIFLFILTPPLALWLRLDDWNLVMNFSYGLLLALSVFMPIKFICLHLLGCYRRYWRFASTEDLLQIAAACAAISLSESIILSFAHAYGQSDVYLLPRSFPISDGLLTFVGVGAARLSVVAFDKSLRQRRSVRSPEKVVIYGAGNAGVALLDAIRQDVQPTLEPVAFVDDDPKKLDLKIRGTSVLGSREQLSEICDRLEAKRVVIAMPSAGGVVIREIVQLCREYNIPTSTLPSLHETISSAVDLRQVREVKIEDLLRRDAIGADLGPVVLELKGKRVLVTGAGGSIGSEICRQVLQCCPEELILMGHGENSVFLIEQELKQTLQELPSVQPDCQTQLTALIADLKDYCRLDDAFQRFKPDVVFHAAAHKHVPLMELNSPEAITNNVLGTQNLVDIALSHQTQRLVMISTDKAVNPSSVMGASKRMGELIVLRAAQRYQVQFCIVRFGNVLGSRGSVVPTLKRQIERGGPVTITHPEVTRYFMTIPEAVHLVLQATVVSQGSEIFMLKMGCPIKIIDLAQDLIRLSGYEVGKDIEIVFTGLRPGEKLHEELLLQDETYEPTANENLLVVKNASTQIPKQLEQGLEALIEAAFENDNGMIRLCLKQLIPGFNLESVSNIVATHRSIKHLKPRKMNKNEQNLKPIQPLLLGPHLSSTNTSELANELSQARASQDFKVLYQPILLLQKDYLVTGFEALLRWQHPQQGLMQSSQFISMADRNQCIHSIGLWGIREVCLQLHALETLNPHPTFTISVNVSSSQILHPGWIPRISQIFQETQVNVSRLCFEIPEQFIVQEGERAIAVLLKMKGLGAKLLLDNFGFSPLKQLSPLMEWVHIFDGFKIDRSRIHELSQDTNNLDFFKTALDLSESWGLDMIATGIESPQQLTQLKNLQCKYGQGYFFLRPINGEQAQALLQVQSLN
jgi:FlaA1/EpsC-like NDP-sugar epimerase/EAL domain-containing protein (putative c-di-GMP-specific phosphodiesterase class I)